MGTNCNCIKHHGAPCEGCIEASGKRARKTVKVAGPKCGFCKKELTPMEFVGQKGFAAEDIIHPDCVKPKKAVEFAFTFYRAFHMADDVNETNERLVKEAVAVLRDHSMPILTDDTLRDKRTIVKVAMEFSNILNRDLGAAKMKKVVATNKKRNDNTCASHDFMDANMAMHEAMGIVLGIGWDAGNFAEDEVMTELWNAAWTLAKKVGFKVTA